MSTIDAARIEREEAYYWASVGREFYDKVYAEALADREDFAFALPAQEDK